jgi:hypothetical protein
MEAGQQSENELVAGVKETVKGVPTIGFGEVVPLPRRARRKARRMNWASVIAAQRSR